jgi:O-antigen/teichoic acid export membrane protein
MKILENMALKAPFDNLHQHDSMNRAFFSLAGDSLVYLVGSAVIGLGNAILVPLYTRYLSPTQFGIYALLDVAVLVMVTVVGLGFNISYLKWYAETDEDTHPRLFGTMVLSATLVALLGGTLLAGLVASPMGERWLQTRTWSFAWALLPLVTLENLQTLLLTDLRASRQALAFSTGSAVRLIGMIGASLWFIAIQKQGVTGVFLGRLFGDVLGVVVLAGFCFRHFSLGVSWDLVKPMVCFGAPVIWSALAVMLLDALGRHFLSQYSTLEQVGFYAAGVKVSNLMRMLLAQPFGAAWGGLMFQVAQWSKARTIYSKAFEYVLVVALLIAAGAALFAPSLFHVFTTSAYFKAMEIFPLLLLVQVCTVVQYPASIGLYLKRKTHLFVPIYAIAVVITLLVNWLLVPGLGIRGAAIAFLSGWALILGLELLLGQKYYPLQIKWGTVVFTIATFFVIAFIGNYSASGVTLKDIALQLLYFTLAAVIAGGWGIANLRQDRQ